MMLRLSPFGNFLRMAGDASIAADVLPSRWRANIFLSCCARQISFSVYHWGKAKVSASIKEEQPAEHEHRRQDSAPEPNTSILRTGFTFALRFRVFFRGTYCSCSAQVLSR
jgi:hypothetical protein